MRLLLDQGLPYTTSILLREAGFDAYHVEELGFSTAEDRTILQLAHRENRVVVTLDSDFHALLALSGASTPSVVHIRMQGLRAESMANLIIEIARDWHQELKDGVALTVRRERIRFRYLPLLTNLGGG